ncbi:MAG: nucleoside-triphosphatase [Cyclobacteriaceae bacterium]
MKVLILTGAKGSGKTTLLSEWTQDWAAGGVLSPVSEGKRHFLSVSSGLPWAMEAEAGEEDVLAVGRYTFSTEAFKQAEATILFDLRAGNHPVIIDEAGPLELEGRGLHGCLEKIGNSQKEASLIVVVREGLAEEVKEKYFSTAEVIITDKQGFPENVRLL